MPTSPSLFTELVPAGTLLPVLVDGAIKGVLLLGLAGVLMWPLRRTSAAGRHAAWTLAMLGLLVLPLLAGLLPGWRVLPTWLTWPNAAASVDPMSTEPPSPSGRIAAPPVTPVTPGELAQIDPPQGAQSGTPLAGAPEEEVGPGSSQGAGLDQERRVANGSAPPITAAPPWPAGTTFRAAIVLVWAVGVLLLLGRLVVGALGLWWLGRSATRLTGGRWVELLTDLRRELGIAQEVTLLQHDRSSMPMTWGLFRPKVLLPSEAPSWSAQRARLVLVHELAHIKRRDCLTQALAYLARALHWFNPLAWYACRQMVAQRERACDDLVLAAGARASEYAQEILHVAGHLRAPRLAAAGAIAMARPSTLEGRLLAILDTTRNRRAVTVGVLVAAVLLLSGLVVPLAMLRANTVPGGRPNEIIDSPGTYLSPSGVCKVQIAREANDVVRFTFVRQRPQGMNSISPVPSGKSDIGWFMSWDEKDRLWAYRPSDGNVRCYYPTAGGGAGSMLLGKYGGWEGVPAAFLTRLPESAKKIYKEAATQPATPESSKAATIRYWGQPIEGLEVSIRLDGQVFDADKPIPVRWAIRNASNQDRAILWHELHYSPVLFDITDASGKVFQNREDIRRSIIDAIPAPPEKIILRPGETKEATFDLSRFLGQVSGELKIVGLYAPKAGQFIPKEYLNAPKFVDAVMARIASDPLILTVHRSSASGRFEMNKEISVEAQVWHEPDPPHRMDPWKVAGAGSLRFEQHDGRLVGKLKLGYASWPKDTYLARLELHDKDGKAIAGAQASVRSSGIIQGVPLWHEESLQFDFGPLAKLGQTASFFRLSLRRAELANNPTVGIYLITGRPKDVPFEKVPLADFTLADEPLISESDIAKYDWESHTIHLKQQAMADRILQHKGIGDAFVVVANDQRLYVGVMASVLSSVVPRAPIIYVGPTAGQFQPPMAVRIYPPPIAGTPDPRNDERLKEALQDLRLLSRPDVASRAATHPAGSTSEFRVAPKPSDLDKAELASYMDWLKAGRVGFWWKDERIRDAAGRIAGRMPEHAWLPISSELTNAPELVTGEYQGQKYVLVSDKPSQKMVSGDGGDAWSFAKANIDNALAIVIDGKVFHAPIIRTALGKTGMITSMIIGKFPEQEAAALVQALRAGMPPAGQPTVDLDALVEALTAKVGGKWEKDLHNAFLPTRMIVRGRIYSAPGNVKVAYDVFPMGGREFATTSFGKLSIHPGRVLVATERLTVVEGMREPSADVSVERAKIIELLELKPWHVPAQPASTTAPATQPATTAPAPARSEKISELHQAAAGGHGDTAQRLVRQGTPINATDENGKTALHLAAMGGHGQTVERLLELGANVNARDKAKQTPLLLAAAAGHRDVAQRLLALGADINLCDDSGSKPVEVARQGGHRELAEFLQTHATASPNTQPARQPAENAEVLDRVGRLMRQVRIVDDPESAIRAALPTKEHSRLMIQRVEKSASPWRREAGKGTAYYIGRPLEDLPRLPDGSVDPSRIKQEYSLVLWIMPPDYQGRPQPLQQSSPVGMADLILSTTNGKVYASYGPTDEAMALLDAIAPLPDELVQRRDARLTEADRIIRQKLIALAKECPQLKQSAGFDDLSRASRNGQIAVSLANPTRASKSGNATAHQPEDAFGVLVYLRPARLEVGQMLTYGLLPNLRLAGLIGSAAADPKLDEALKKIIADALQPLRQLDAAIGR